MTAAPAERPDRMLVSALWWAQQGVPVFPLAWPTAKDSGYACSCGKSDCPNPAKHPLTPNGLNDGSTDPERIRAWWTRWPNANIGLRTGVAFDLLDVDGPTGFANLQPIIEELGGEPQAAAVCISGRIDGGRHYYMQPAGKKALAGGKTSPPGIDVKGSGGYAVGPPSRHISGTEYRWANGLQYGNATGTVPWERVYDELTARAPKKARDERPSTTSSAPFAQPGTPGDGSRIDNFGRAVLDSILEEMNGAGQGHRWTTFATECAMKLARAVAGGSVDRAAGVAELQAAARRSGLASAEVERLEELLDDALAKGITDPIRPREDRNEQAKTWTEQESEQTGWERPDSMTVRVPEFPTWALGPLEADCLRLADDLQTPVDLIAMLTLATVAASVRGRARVHIRGTWSEPLNLYVLVLAGAGETKSPALGVISAPLRELEQALMDREAAEVSRRKQARRLQEGRLKKAEAAAVNATGEDRQVAEDHADRERRTLDGMPEAVAPRLLAGDTTAEGLVRLLSEQGGVMASLTAEGGLFDTLAGGRYSGGMANLDAVLQAHDGREPIMVDRKVGDPIRVERPCLTLGLAVQPQVLAAASTSEAAVGRGFLARFLFSYPASRVGRREVEREPSTQGFDSFGDVIRSIDTFLSPGSVSFGDASVEGVFSLPTTTLSYFNAFRADLEPRRGPSGDLAGIAAWASKLDGQVARLAALLELVHLAGHRQNRQNPRPLSVEPDRMAAACAIAEYLIEHAQAAHRLMAGRQLAAGHPAQQLLGWARKTGSPTFTVRDAHRALQGRTDFTEAADVKAAAEVLEAHGYLRLLEPEKKPGRPSVTYAVNPLDPEEPA